MAHLPSRPEHALFPRQSGTSTGEQLLGLISSPFDTQVQTKAVIASLVWSLPLTVLMVFTFCFLRPHNYVVYAPRVKYADTKHAPPPVSKGFFAWIVPTIKTTEQELVQKVGLDAALFMRFIRMMRNIMSLCTLVACGILIPVNFLRSGEQTGDFAILLRMTPQFGFNPSSYWAYVVCAYVFTGITFFFLWTNYRAVLKLRRQYFDSAEYQRSLHSRTLLLTDVPKEYRTDDGIVQITEEIMMTPDTPRAAIARNVKDLPDLVEEHEETVKRLEKHLARYLKNPDKLPAKRPACKVNSSDKAYTKGQKVDAIEYLSARIKELEIEIKQVRESVDKRNPLPYGFASYSSISEAHSVAHMGRKKAPRGTIVRLAPQPNDLVWKNLAISAKARSRNNFINNLWVALLTIFWVGPNIFIAVFLSNLSNIGKFSPGFAQNLKDYPVGWAIVQGVGAPLLTTLFYYYLPAIFRRLCVSAGDVSKTSRERHVMHKLYSFFVFNNFVVFSIFSTLATWIATVVSEMKSGDTNFIDAVRASHPLQSLIQGLCAVTPYWISWLLQRNLGAALDLSQLVGLLWGGFSRKFLAPTPREQIELTAPQPFDYASYYNLFLYYGTIALCMGPLQPLIFAVAAFYFWLDSFARKYMVLYVTITKYESGGMFWRSVYNRIIFVTVLSNVIIALVITALASVITGKSGPDGTAINWQMLAAMAPLIPLTIAFKWYCARNFDGPIHWYQTSQGLKDTEHSAEGGMSDKKAKKERIGVRFGHPALYKPLITPMVSAKSQHLLKSLYAGRLSLDNSATSGFSDVYMDVMDSNRPGKPGANSPFEFVSESNMDFEHFKNRPEFRDQAGGNGVLFGHAPDATRPGTPASGLTRVGTSDTLDSFSKPLPHGHHYQSSGDYDSRTHSRESSLGKPGAEFAYPRGYHQTPSALREHSPAGSAYSDDGRGPQGFTQPRAPMPHRPGLSQQISREGLVGGAADMGHAGYARAPTADVTPGFESGGEETSYDYFRRGRQG